MVLEIIDKDSTSADRLKKKSDDIKTPPLIPPLSLVS